MGLHLRYQGTRFWLTRQETIVGRSRSCAVMVASAVASREHCSIKRSGDDLFVSDLGSKNGTFVNDRRIKKDKKLKVGDTIRIGDHTLEVIEQAADSNRPPAEARDAEGPRSEPSAADEPLLDTAEEKTADRHSPVPPP